MNFNTLLLKPRKLWIYYTYTCARQKAYVFNDVFHSVIEGLVIGIPLSSLLCIFLWTILKKNSSVNINFLAGLDMCMILLLLSHPNWSHIYSHPKLTFLVCSNHWLIRLIAAVKLKTLNIYLFLMHLFLSTLADSQ